MTPIRRLLMFLAVALLFTPAGYAYADADDTTVQAFTIAAPLVTLIVSLIIPLINGFLTKASTPSSVKAIGTILLNTASAVIINGMVADGSSAFSSTTLYTAILGSVISIATYAGVYVPFNLTSRPGGKLAGVGVK